MYPNKLDITPNKAVQIYNFALENNAIVEAKTFRNFHRTVIFTNRGLVALRVNKKIKTSSLEPFAGFDNKIAQIEQQFGQIAIKPYTI